MQYYASPVAADGKLFMLSASSAWWQRSWSRTAASSEVSGRPISTTWCYATPAIADERIYLRTRGHLYAFGLE